MSYQFILIGCLVFAAGSVFADQVVKFPKEDLATETVLPVFEERQVVKDRLVTRDGRFEFGVSSGFTMTEPLYNKQNFHLDAYYNFNEFHAVNINYISLSEGLNGTGQDLKEGKGLDTGEAFDAGLAPQVESFLFVNYAYTAYYGKISLTKEFVMNMHWHLLGGLGTAAIGDQNNVALNLGFGQKFYLGSRFALTTDLKLLYYNSVDPTSVNLNPSTVTAELPYGSFEEKSYIHVNLSFGLAVLL